MRYEDKPFMYVYVYVYRRLCHRVPLPAFLSTLRCFNAALRICHRSQLCHSLLSSPLPLFSLIGTPDVMLMLLTQPSLTLSALTLPSCMTDYDYHLLIAMMVEHAGIIEKDRGLSSNYSQMS